MTAPAIRLYPYQRRWFMDRSRFKLAMYARQTGKTFTTTAEIVDDCYQAMSEGTRARWVILSRGERQAQEAMDEGIKRHAAAYNMALESLEYEWVCDQTKVKALEVTLPGGSKITALPANPDTARGFSANVFLDEFAFHKDSRAIWKALFPVISAGHKLRVASTPNGKGNKFYELVSATDPAWSRHVVDIHQAVADGLPRDIPALRAAIADEDAWAQEFELKFLDEASAWLSYELISSVEHDLAGIPALYAGGPCFVGVDIAARNDLFVIWVWEAVGDVLWCREIIEERRIKFARQDQLLDDVFARYRVLSCAMDQTGMGEKPVEDAQARHGSMRVQGVLFTLPNKQMLATTGKEAFEDRRVRIPEGRPELRADLHKLRKVTGLTGAPRFLADSDSAGHADRTWAAFLGIAAAAHPPAPMEHQSVPRQAASAEPTLGRTSPRHAEFVTGARDAHDMRFAP
jgi:phage FluMu gp28-like protein